MVPRRSIAASVDVQPQRMQALVVQPAGLGDAGRVVSLEHFGASGSYQVLYEKFGITAEAVVAAARESIAAAAR